MFSIEMFIGVLIIFGVVALYLNALATMAIWADPTLGTSQKYIQMLLVWLIPFVGSCLVLRLTFSIFPHSKLRSKIPWGFRGMILGRSKVIQSPDNSIEEYYGSGRMNRDGYIGRNSREIDAEVDE